ncbi:MAG: hypothetical protein WA940_09145 [Sphingopyxis sp.]
MGSELQFGEGILMKRFKSYFANGWLNYGAPKGKTAHHLFMWLGVYDENDETKQASADDRLNALGWVFDPKAAEAALSARKSAEKAA